MCELCSTDLSNRFEILNCICQCNEGNSVHNSKDEVDNKDREGGDKQFVGSDGDNEDKQGAELDGLHNNP